MSTSLVNTPMDSTHCDLCDKQDQEIVSHLFRHCEWIKHMKQDLEAWIGVTLTGGEIRRALTTIWGAKYYNTWRARNSKHYRGKYIQLTEVETQIGRDIKIRLELFSVSKIFMFRLCC